MTSEIALLIDKYAVPVDFLEDGNVSGIINLFKGVFMTHTSEEITPELVTDMTRISNYVANNFKDVMTKWRTYELQAFRNASAFDIVNSGIDIWQEPLYRSNQVFYQAVRKELVRAGTDYPWETSD